VFCGTADGPTGPLSQGMMDVVDTAVGRDRPGDGWAPLWAATLRPADRAALDPGIPDDLDRHPDVLVVGGGIMGLTTALFCREAGLGRVLVIEADRLASAASGGDGGVLAPDLHQLTDPPAFVDLARSSLALYRQLAQEWDEEERMLWGAPGLLLFPEGLPSGLRPWPQVELLGTDQVAELVPDLVSVPAALLARDQARLHPLRLAAALARRAGSVATGVTMTNIQVAGDRIVRVHTTAGDLEPGVVVFATGLAPAPWVSVPQRLVKGHLLVTEPVGFHLRCGLHAPGLGVGSLEDGSLLVGGTREEGDASPQVRGKVVQRIRRRLGELLPAARATRLRYRWCCFRPAMADGQPVIDRVSGLDNAWVSAGHDGTGLLLAPATGQALAAWIATGRPPSLVRSFHLSRFGRST
jgi:glycine/D-amino acid oxidase-like deaminating enzyme